MSRDEEIAALRAGESLPVDRVTELRWTGMEAIRREFIRCLLDAHFPIDTLSIYWERGPEFMLTNRVENAMRKLVFGIRHRVVGEFWDLWLLCYPDEANIKMAVEREIDRMVNAIKALLSA